MNTSFIDTNDVPKGQTIFVDGRMEVVPDLSHHFSVIARLRRPSPLKQLARYINQGDLIMLAGGMPHPDVFPYDSLSAKVLAHDMYEPSSSGSSRSTAAGSSGKSPLGWLWNMLGYGTASGPYTEDIMIPKYAPSGNRTDNQLASALQYGTAMGLVQLQKFVHEFAMKALRPYLPTATTILTTGNTDAWGRCVETFCNPGDGLLVEEWTYPSALGAARPHGVTPIPIAMDGEGMRADALEKVLAGWNPDERGGMKRPHIAYLVPIGQNPSGATMGVQRKKEIYEICVKYDVLICEDDPYFFLQEGTYVPHAYRAARGTGKTTASTPEEWIESLAPSFIKFDYQGRVIRMDSFSKTVAPGARLGFFTCSPLFAERLQRVGEITTNAPCGFGQALITELIANKWGYDKWIRWLQGIQGQYTQRRDRLLDAINKEFTLSQGVSETAFLSGTPVLNASKKRVPSFGAYAVEKNHHDTTWFSFIPPTSGMFVWIRVHLVNHPDFRQRSGEDEPEESLEAKLFYMLADHKLLIGPGWFFTTRLEDEPLPQASLQDPVTKRLLIGSGSNGGDGSNDPSGNPEDHDPTKYAHFRLSFSSATPEEMTKAVEIMAHVMEKFFKGLH